MTFDIMTQPQSRNKLTTLPDVGNLVALRKGIVVAIDDDFRVLRNTGGSLDPRKDGCLPVRQCRFSKYRPAEL
jgi:hypothetical protein